VSRFPVREARLGKYVRRVRRFIEFLGERLPALGPSFFMASLTGRYTSSPETSFEFDRPVARQCISLREICATTLTNDYWEITLPNSLATSALRLIAPAPPGGPIDISARLI
jgi:hypothetical protein